MMTSLISKRQQAKNEKILQDLILSVPGNDKCADCQTNNPGWASWNLGIFICMRCAALHRKLGTHVSKVKSLSMDTWNADQVETMKRVGNTTSNRTFNPKNAKPSIPLDMDEANSAMERFIRQKYETRSLTSTPPVDHTRSISINSLEHPPPPLPPKPGRKFGFGLRSSSSPMDRNDRMTPPRSPDRQMAPRNKQSRVLGSSIGNQEDDFDGKLATLREMGFRDSRRNSTLLKSYNGNLDRTVEALVKLDSQVSAPTGTLTPTSSSSGLTIEKKRAAVGPLSTTEINHTTQRSFTSPTPPTQTFQPQASYAQSQQSQPIDPSLQTAFQNVQLSQTPQPPTSTNPYLMNHVPQQTYTSTGHQQNNPFLRQTQSQIFQHTASPWSAGSANPWHNQPLSQTPQCLTMHDHQAGYFAPAATSFQPQITGYNPFLPHANTFPQQQPQSSPYTPTVSYLPQSQPLNSNFSAQPEQHTAMSMTPMYSTMPTTQGHQSQSPAPQLVQRPYQQQQQPQVPFRHDKSSILALYNMPHLAPQRPLEQQQQGSQQAVDQQAGLQTGAPFLPQQRSATMPVSLPSGSMNPFLPSSATTNGSTAPQYTGH